MLILRELTIDDAQALTRIYSGASVRHTTGTELTIAQAQQKVRTALARAADTPRAQWSWGNGYATEAVEYVVAFAFTTAGLERLEAMHHPDNPASGRVLTKVGFTHTGAFDRHAEDGTVVAYQVREPETAGHTGGPGSTQGELTPLRRRCAGTAGGRPVRRCRRE